MIEIYIYKTFTSIVSSAVWWQIFWNFGKMIILSLLNKIEKSMFKSQNIDVDEFVLKNFDVYGNFILYEQVIDMSIIC